MSYQKNKSLEDGVEVIKALAAIGEPVGSRELARMLGMETTRTNRILRTLADMGIAEQDGDRKYQPGPGIHVLSSLSMRGSSLLKVAFPIMEAYRNRDYIIALGVLWREQVSYLIFASPEQPLMQGLAPDKLYLASKSSIGRLLLNPENTKGYVAVAHGETKSLAVGVGGNSVLAGLAYSMVPNSEEKKAVDELKKIAWEIDKKLMR